MSWIEQLNNIELKVVTGEGSEFFPLWKSNTRERQMNASIFNFNNVEGSLVKRGKTPSFKYAYELHFQGENSYDEALRFEEAAKDQRPWTFTHPVYGQLLVQPISMKRDDNFQNDTIISGELYETIPDTYPNTLASIEELIAQGAEEAAVVVGELYADDFELVPEALLKIVNAINKMAEIYGKIASVAQDIKDLQDKLNNVLNAIDNILLGPERFMNAVTDLARAPAKFISSVKDRINGFKETFAEMKLAIGGLQNLLGFGNTATKKFYEGLSTSIMIGLVESSVIKTSDNIEEKQLTGEIEISDYQTRSEVVEIIEDIKSQYLDYVNSLGLLQTEIDATPESYTPKQRNIIAIKNIANKASGQLFQVATEAKIERKYTVPENTNIIVLVHRLLGTIDDTIIQNFIESNDIKLEERIQIPKGREIIYYL